MGDKTEGGWTADATQTKDGRRNLLVSVDNTNATDIKRYALFDLDKILSEMRVVSA